MSDMKKGSGRREYRRKRRVRNRILACLFLVLFVVLVIAAAVFGIKALAEGKLKGKDDGAEAAPVTEEAAGAEAEVPEAEEPEEKIIETPKPLEPEELMTESEETVSEDNAVVRDPAVAAILDKMDLKQKADALFIVAPEAITGVDKATKALEGTKEALGEYAIGGVIYDADNVTGADQFKEMIKNTTDYYEEIYGRKLIIAVTEEGAYNTVAGKSTAVSAKTKASELGKNIDSEKAYSEYKEIAEYLKEYGVTLNIAPQGSVATGDKCYLGDRIFSSDPNVVEALASSAVKGLQDGGIDAAISAFPGEGELAAPAENQEAVTERAYTDMRECEFLPYQAAIEAGVSAVTVSNIIWANGDEGNSTDVTASCSISKQMIQEILRDALGFEGVVITAPLDEKGFSGAASMERAAVEAVMAGADMICIRNAEDFRTAREGLLKAIEKGEISEERLDESLERIIKNLILE